MNSFNLEIIKKKMLIKYPFFGSVITSVPIISINYSKVKTAATNGKQILYNQEFMNSLNEEGQIFILSHEVLHIALNHIQRSKGKVIKIWNKATDAVINAHLQKDGLKIVGGGIDMPEAINYDAEELYEKLLKEQEEKKKSKPQSKSTENNDSVNKSDLSEVTEQDEGEEQSNNADETEQEQSVAGTEIGENQGKLEQGNEPDKSTDLEEDREEKSDDFEDNDIDNHELWEEAIKKIEAETDIADESVKKDNTISEQSNPNSNQNTTQQQNEDNSDVGEKEAFNKNREMKKKIYSNLMRELSNTAAEVGKTTKEQIIQIGEVGKSKPIVDWRRCLREATRRDVDWSYKNAQIKNGIILSRLNQIPMPETEIVLDTSGSISKELLKNFLKECKNIFKQSKVKVGCFDTKFYGFQEVRDLKDIDNLRFQGGGGTDFDVAVNAFTKRVENKIIFTDGCASMPQQKVNAIWMVFGGTKINPIGGRVIEITDEQLRKLQLYKNTEDFER